MFGNVLGALEPKEPKMCCSTGLCRLGSLRDRWCVVLKPPGFAGAAAPPAPSLESTLKAFLPEGRVLPDVFFFSSSTGVIRLLIHWRLSKCGKCCYHSCHSHEHIGQGDCETVMEKSPGKPMVTW